MITLRYSCLLTLTRQASFDILGTEQLEQLCGSSCRADLTALRAKIKKACTAPTDVMVPGSIAYPGRSLTDIVFC